VTDFSQFWLRAAVACYGFSLVDAILTILRGGSSFFRYALASFISGALFHFVAVVEGSAAAGHLLANNFFETSSLCALLLAAVFLFVYWRHQFAGLNVILYPLVFLLALIGALGTPVAPWQDPRVRDAWLLTHIVLVLAGYAALLLGAGAALFYLLQERRLKRHSSPRGLWARLASGRLPPLETLDLLTTRAISVGFVSVTLSVVAASIWAFVETGTAWIGEAKILVSLLTWLFYLVLVFLRIAVGWRGRRAAVLTLAVVGLAALTWAAHVGLRPLLEK
jgi:ABC-type uncharacterized transport system permease subunit